MEVQAAILWRANGVLNAANSKRGQGRHFIKANRRAIEAPMNKILDKIEAFSDEWGFEFERKGVAFSMKVGDNKDGLGEFEDYLFNTKLDIEPYLMTEEVLQDIDGIGMEDEMWLHPFLTEHYEKFLPQEEDEEAEEVD